MNNLKTKCYAYNLEIEKIKVCIKILYVILSLIILIYIIIPEDIENLFLFQ